MFLDESIGNVFLIILAVRTTGSFRRQKFSAIEAVIVDSILALTPLPKPSESTHTNLFSSCIFRDMKVSPQQNLPFLFTFYTTTSKKYCKCILSFFSLMAMLYFLVSSCDSTIELSIVSVNEAFSPNRNAIC